jgi:hypothetical protein
MPIDSIFVANQVLLGQTYRGEQQMQPTFDRRFVVVYLSFWVAVLWLLGYYGRLQWTKTRQLLPVFLAPEHVIAGN